ncbi:MAG: sigma 54-interacting transcriptional regulator [Thermoanaerobacteraceae bacterium]|nr:sigma 54-interacting transcriptional regulator [Thermoanaerobacteraceae bacterium]
MDKLIKNFSQDILEMIDMGIHIVDAKGNTVFYNAAMGRLEMMEPSNVIGKNLMEVFPSLNRGSSTLLHVLQTGETIVDKVQTYFNCRGQEITTINTTCPLIKNNRIVGAVEIARDITKLKELSEKVSYTHKSAKNKSSKQDRQLTRYSFSDIIGESRSIRSAVEIAKKAAQTSSSVLIYGETGTGKELFAQSIHQASRRGGKAFITQNCAALPESLLEGILFGTVKGGFTGAVDRPGLFELADGGTLLLDEINSMGTNLQAKLLRVLQEGLVRRIGDTGVIPVDVRVIATANENPMESMEKGILRKDLFYRLSVVYIRIPPLRERKEDIPVLTRHFINKLNIKLGKNVRGVSRGVKKLFMNYDWPGNVRELENAIEGAMNVISDELIDVGHLPAYILEDYMRSAGEINEDEYETPMPVYRDYKGDVSLDKMLEEMEKEIIIDTLKTCSGNITRSAEKLNIKRQTLQYKMKKYGLSM